MVNKCCVLDISFLAGFFRQFISKVYHVIQVLPEREGLFPCVRSSSIQVVVKLDGVDRRCRAEDCHIYFFYER
jgi:hypothetical protein